MNVRYSLGSTLFLALAFALAAGGCGGPASQTGDLTGSGGCVPESCASLGADCGQVADGCGNLLDCGGCAANETCGGGGAANVCGVGACTPTTCAAQGKNCGSISDGCGGTLACGSCGSGETCGAGGTANVCGSAAPAECQPGAWAKEVSRVFTSSCQGCHSSYGTYSGVAGNATRIRSEISSGAMPKGGALSAADKAMVLGWIDCGTPQ